MWRGSLQASALGAETKRGGRHAFEAGSQALRCALGSERTVSFKKPCATSMHITLTWLCLPFLLKWE